MKNIALFNLFVSVISLFGGLTSAEASDVHVLNSNTYDKWLKDQDIALIEFFAPWCGHCKSLKPHYEKAATTLKAAKIPLAQVDCDQDKDLCKKAEIRGFPTLKIYRDGELSEYKGSRDESGIVEYMKRLQKPALVPIDSDSFDEFSSYGDIVVIGFMDSKDSEEAKVLEKVADSNRDTFNAGIVTDKALAKEVGVSSPAVVIFKKFDEPKVVYKGDYNVDDLSYFTNMHILPAIGDISQKRYSTYVDLGLPIFHILFDTNDTKSELKEVLNPIAKDFRGKIIFSLCNATMFPGPAKRVGFEKGGYTLYLYNQTDSTFYKYPQDKNLDADNVKEFLVDFLGGKVKPHYRSLPIPKNNDGDILTVVSEQFYKYVFDPKNDVLLMFVSPDCSSCKKMEPIYAAMAKKMKGNPNLVIAKMDAVQNDIPEQNKFDMFVFPTIFMIRANDNKIIKFGKRGSEDAYIDFIKENASLEHNYPKLDFDEDEFDHDEF